MTSRVGRTIGPSVPVVRILRETRTLHAHDAEALSGWGLHHHPALQAVHDVRAQPLKARHFGTDIVGLDIQVHAALVIDALNAQWVRPAGSPTSDNYRDCPNG